MFSFIHADELKIHALASPMKWKELPLSNCSAKHCKVFHLIQTMMQTTTNLSVTLLMNNDFHDI